MWARDLWASGAGKGIVGKDNGKGTGEKGMREGTCGQGMQGRGIVGICMLGREL